MSPSPGAWSKLFIRDKFPSPTGKKAGTACPVPLYCKEQFLSKPQPHLARIGSELGRLQLPLGRISDLGSVLRGLKEKILETHS